MRKFLAILAALMALAPSRARAIETRFYEQYGVHMTYAARTSNVSTHTVAGILVGYSMLAVGGTADFEFKHSTVAWMVDPSFTPAPNTDPNINLSSTSYLLNGIALNNTEHGFVTNPVIYLKRIDQPGTTVYIYIDYLKPRYPGEF